MPFFIAWIAGYILPLLSLLFTKCLILPCLENSTFFLFAMCTPFVYVKFFNIAILSSVGLKFSIFLIFVACLSQSSIFHATAWYNLRERSFSCSSCTPSQMNWNTAHNNMISNHFVLKFSIFVRFHDILQTPNISVNNFW